VDPKITRTERIHADGIERWRRVLEPAAVERIVRRTERVWSRLDRSAEPLLSAAGTR
jgi:hypothetical protein